MAAMMLAADRIAANVMMAKPELRDGLYRKIPRRFGRVAPFACCVQSGGSAGDA